MRGQSTQRVAVTLLDHEGCTMKVMGWTMAALVLVTGAWVGFTATARAAEYADIDEIMKKINGGKGYHRLLKKTLAGSDVDWAKVQEQCKDYARLAADLGKNKPPVGEAASWKKLCDEYTVDAKALDTAAQKKDLEATKIAWGKLDKSCKACHEAHRE
jgi:cytochrome c556